MVNTTGSQVYTYANRQRLPTYKGNKKQGNPRYFLGSYKGRDMNKYNNQLDPYTYLSYHYRRHGRLGFNGMGNIMLNQPNSYAAYYYPQIYMKSGKGLSAGWTYPYLH
jgi:hypothetical protein